MALGKCAGCKDTIHTKKAHVYMYAKHWHKGCLKAYKKPGARR